MFREHFKQYKNKTCDYSTVYDLNNEEFIANQDVLKIQLLDNAFINTYSLKSTKKWKVYRLKSVPGLIFIRNPFLPEGQRYWIAQSLISYTKKPNRTNLDVQNLLSEAEDWWETCASQKSCNNKLLDKLRWVTLGYHHNWDTKVYSEDAKSDFPRDLHHFSRYILSVLGFNEFNPEAAIVNYYHMNSTLSGHTDHSENNLEAPLLSLSFGQTAIFMIGGKSIEDKPTAIFLRSGDIIVMSKESRLCYHGVPKIVPATVEPWNEEVLNCDNQTFEAIDQEVVKICSANNLWAPLGDYLQRSRININVRQVLDAGQTKLYD